MTGWDLIRIHPRMRLVRVITIAVAVVTALAVAPARVEAASVGEIHTGDAPDPSVLYAGGVYYTYTTNRDGVHIPVYTSTDLANWTFAGDAMPGHATWSDGHDIWAPAVAFIGGRYVLYYALPHQGTGRHCISVATSNSPLGPFVDATVGPFVCLLDQGGSIDPSVYFDGAGGVHLLFKSEGIYGAQPTRLWSQQLAADGLAVMGAPVAILTTERDWEQPIIENPSMVAYNGRIFLFYSTGDWDSPDYAVGYAVCDSVSGPCRRPLDRPLLSSFDDEVGPGGPSVFVDDRRRLMMAYHGWRGGVGYSSNGYRALAIRLVSAAGDVLTVEGAPARGNDLRPSFTSEIAATSTGRGYMLSATSGAVASFGDARFAGSTANLVLNQPVMGLAFTPDDRGYWLAALDGGIFCFGNAAFYGSLGGIRLNQPVTAMASTTSGRGYWLIAQDGGVFTFGDAPFFGSLGGIALNQPIVGMTPTASGQGYWLVAADGGVFAFGDAAFYGSTGGIRLMSPITAITATQGGRGYWMIASDGGVFSFGDAEFLGSAVGLRRGETTGIAAAPGRRGYWVSTASGSVIAFGPIPHLGDT